MSIYDTERVRKHKLAEAVSLDYLLLNNFTNSELMSIVGDGKPKPAKKPTKTYEQYISSAKAKKQSPTYLEIFNSNAQNYNKKQ